MLVLVRVDHPQKKILSWNTHSIPSVAAAVLFGFLAGTLCNFATQLKFLAGYDDALDVSPFVCKSGCTMFDFSSL
jgi:hypothetical protein